ncbi:MAG: signal recognition particle-docking protein FtsY [Christensenellaceae bacterium]|nr:signal recognition particle-docking protein FtsY [Christensenellaceae bacterium]
MGLFKKLFGGLAKTASNITQSIAQIFTKELDDEFYDDLTAVLLSADMGMEATEQIIDDIKRTAKRDGIKTETQLKQALAQSIAEILSATKTEPSVSSEKFSPPEGARGGVSRSRLENFEEEMLGSTSAQEIIMVVGVNGVGKTTSIGKLASYYKSQKKSVLIVAADTFRAAATEQLETWATRAGVRIVKQAQGADPASVVFDAMTSAKAKNDDIVIIDTAGRLHNKEHLMTELEKIDRVVGKFDMPNYKKYIVLDATTGQNALNQVEVFNDAVNLDGVILTKLDGTAKGGVVVAIKQKFGLPVLFVGVGEKIDDLLPFDPLEFSRAIIGLENT